MSFLVDPPLLVAAGSAIERIAGDDPRGRRRADHLERAVLAAFLATSLSLYANLGWTRWLWRLCGAESGRDWMLNSGVTSFEHRQPPWPVHALAAALFATYPLWSHLGRRLGRRTHRR